MPILNINDINVVNLANTEFHYPGDVTHFNTIGRFWMAKLLLGQFTDIINQNMEGYKYYKDEQLNN